MAELELRIRGLDELRAALRAIPDKLRRRALRNALAAGGRIVRDEARRNAPVLRRPDPRRKPGTVRDAIVVRTSRIARQAGNVGVYVNVRPLTKGQIRAFKEGSGSKGANNPNDPYYWRWLEFGREGQAAQAAVPARIVMRGGRVRLRLGLARAARRAVGALPAHRFLQAGANRLGDALRRFEQVLGPAVAKLNQRQEP